MSIVAQLVPRRITLDELIALSDEIAALARAGVPLDAGLRAIGRDMPGRLGKLAESIGKRLEAGESLATIVGTSGDLFPPAYRAVIEAGLRVGRLPAALEDVATAARRAAQLRRSVMIALIYPVIVLLVAFQLLAFSVAKLLPVMVKMCAEWDLHPPGLEALATGLHATLPFWAFGFPLFFLAWLAWTWYRSGQVGYGVRIHPLFGFGLLGALVQLRQAGELAAINELLAMLLEHGVPLPEALRLSAAAVGSTPIERGASELAERLERGEPLAKPPAGFPPLLACMLASPHAQGELPAILRRSAERYREDAARRAQWVSLYFPIFVTIIFAGGAVVLYAAITFGPWLLLLRRIAEEA